MIDNINIRNNLKTPDDIMAELALIESQLQSYADGPARTCDNFEKALVQAIEHDGNVDQKAWLEKQRNQYHEITKGYGTDISITTLAILAFNSLNMNTDARGHTLIGILIGGAVALSVMKRKALATRIYNKKLESFCEQSENISLKIISFNLLEENARIKGLLAQREQLTANYQGLGPNGKLTPDLQEWVDDVARCADEQEMREIFGSRNSHLLKNLRVCNSLIVACAQQGSLNILYDIAPQLEYNIRIVYSGNEPMVLPLTDRYKP